MIPSTRYWIVGCATAIAAIAVVLGGPDLRKIAADSRLLLAGRVPTLASVRFSQTEWFLLDPTRVPQRSGRLRLADLVVSCNTQEFSIHVRSRNAEGIGAPAFVDTETGHTLPYRLILDNSAAGFIGPEAHLADGRKLVRAHGRSMALDIELIPGTSPAAGIYAEKLVVVITAW